MISPLCPIENSDLSQMKESLHSRHQIMITVPIEQFFPNFSPILRILRKSKPRLQKLKDF